MTLIGTDARMAYETTAPFYDAFTAHHDYELWVSALLDLTRRHGLAGTRLLDVGCGTGRSFEPFLRRGWAVTGCDVSARMLERARARAGDDAELHLADLRALPRFGAHDLVLALDDVVNYLTAEAELAGAFAGLAANAAPGGLVLFDVNTLASYRGFFCDTVAVDSADGALLLWRGRGRRDCAPGELTEASFDAFVPGPGGGLRRHACVHRQRHHPGPVLRAALAGAGLEVLGVFGQGFDARPEPGADELRHTKAIYLARRAPEQGEGVS